MVKPFKPLNPIANRWFRTAKLSVPLRPCVKTNSFAHRADPLSAVTSNHALQLRFPRSNAPIVFQ